MTPRRVVTGVGGDGKARFVGDSPAPVVLRNEAAPGFESISLWATDDVPDVPGDGTDPVRPDQQFFPGPGGSRFLIDVFPPGFGTDALYQHASATVDYGVVLSGEITLVLDTGDEVTLCATDAVVQNGTRHAWRNDTEEPAVLAFVVLGGKP